MTNTEIIVKRVAGAGGRMRTVAICPTIQHWHGNAAQAAKCEARTAAAIAKRIAKEGATR